MAERIERIGVGQTIIRHPGIAYFNPDGRETYDGGVIEIGAVRFFSCTVSFQDTPDDPLTVYVWKDSQADNLLAQAQVIIGTRNTADRLRIWAKISETVFPKDQHAIDQYVFASPIVPGEEEILIASMRKPGSWNVLQESMQGRDGTVTYGYQLPPELVIAANPQGRIFLIPSYWYDQHIQNLRQSMGIPAIED